MNQDISICVLTENEMGWTEPFVPFWGKSGR